MRKTPSGERHIIKSNSVSQTLGEAVKTHIGEEEERRSGETRRFLNLRNASFAGGSKGKEGITCVHQ